MPEPINPWKTLTSRTVHQSPWLTLYEDDVIKPNGKPGKYTYTQSPPFVLIVAHDGEHIIMVDQFRYPLKRIMTELPGGAIDKGEQPLVAAQREFEEETGLAANTWTKLGSIHNPNLATIFLAEGLTPTSKDQLNDDGITKVLRLTWTEIDRMIKTGELTDSKTLAALLLFERHHPPHNG